jgi:hypothetical protein
MNNEFILKWWLDKYAQKVVNFITTNIQFEELSDYDLEAKRRTLLLEYIDTTDSLMLEYLLANMPGFLDILYKIVYKPDVSIDDKMTPTDQVSIKVGKKRNA